MNPHFTSNRRFLIGIDEAGRGPVLGPMIVAMVIVEKSNIRDLVRTGVKDSKCFGSNPFAHSKRCSIARNIRKISKKVSTVTVSPESIDKSGITHAEIAAIARLLKRIPPSIAGTVFIDAQGMMSRRVFLRHLREYLGGVLHFPLVYEPHCDSNYPVVSAASIVAKIRRDKTLWKLLGRTDVSGYPNAITAHFIKQYFEKHSQLPLCVRKTWQWPPLQQFLD